MTTSPLVRALERLVDTALVGMLVCVACLPVLTVLPALSAAAEVLGDGDPHALRRYWPAFRRRLRRGTALGAAWMAAAAVALLDVAWAALRLATAPGPVPTAVLAAGVMLIIGLLAVLPHLVSHLLEAPTAVGALRDAAVMAVAAPLVTLLWSAAVVASAPVVVALPVLAPLGLGAAALGCTACARRARSRLLAHRPTHLPTHRPMTRNEAHA